MSTKKSEAVKFLEKKTGGPLTLGRFLRSIRLGEEATLKDFARSLGVSLQHLSDIENDRRVVSLERSAHFAVLLGYSKAQFVQLAVQDMLNNSGLEKLRVKVS